MHLGSQLALWDAIWWSEWYLANGSGNNQIKIHLTLLNGISSHIQ